MTLTKLQKEYCKINGWIKLKGILINTTAINTDYSEFFIPDECASDYYEKCSKWVSEEGDDDGMFDDSEIIGHIEDYAEISFKDFKFQKRKKAVRYDKR